MGRVNSYFTTTIKNMLNKVGPRMDLWGCSWFCDWVQVGIDAYIPHRKYQVKPHSSLWLAAACAAAITNRNHSFRLYKKNKSSESKVKFKQDSNDCKRVLKAAKLVYANKQKSISLPRNMALGTFGKFLIMFSTEVNLIYLPYSLPGGVFFCI